jgi:anti-sigma B factor antagonist
MSIRLVTCGPPTIVEISGEIDLSTTQLLTELAEHLTRQRPTQVVLDMAKVSFFCADGLRALMNVRARVTAAGGQILLRHPSPMTWRVLTLTQTDHLFPTDTAVTPNAMASNA